MHRLAFLFWVETLGGISWLQTIDRDLGRASPFVFFSTGCDRHHSSHQNCTHTCPPKAGARAPTTSEIHETLQKPSYQWLHSAHSLLPKPWRVNIHTDRLEHNPLSPHLDFAVPTWDSHRNSAARCLFPSCPSLFDSRLDQPAHSFTSSWQLVCSKRSSGSPGLTSWPQRSPTIFGLFMLVTAAGFIAHLEILTSSHYWIFTPAPCFSLGDLSSSI